MLYSSDRMHRRSWGAALLLAALPFLGCQESEEIVSYTVPKKPPTPVIKTKAPEAVPVNAPFANPPATTTALADPATGPDRMLGAIVPLPKQTWFFKLTGPEAPVAAAREALIAFLRAVEFVGEQGEPKWTLPAGWKDAGARPMRFATLEFESEGAKLELAISSLPTQGELDGFLTMNLNRWLGQMALQESTLEAMRAAKQIETIELPGGNQATLANLRGKQKSGGMTPPFAR